jgi:hypothetical protein
MKNYLLALGPDVWTFALEGYKVPEDITVDNEGKKKFWNHAKALNTLQLSLNKKVIAKVLNSKNAKDLWQKLETIYARDSKVTKAKLQTLRVQYEGLKMKEEENISEYLERVDEVVNVIRGLGETIEDIDIVDKVLRTLPMVYNPEVSTLEDRQGTENITLDELYGILTTYELRIGWENPSKEEAAFKALNNPKDQEQRFKSNPQEDSFDKEEANFIKKLQKGLGKYKGKFPFKCFDCSKVGHIASKCPYSKGTPEDGKDTRKFFKKTSYKKDYYKGNKNFITKNEDSSSNSSENEESEVMFLGIEEINENDSKSQEESDEEAEVNMEAELLSALSELKKYKNKYRRLKNFVIEQREREE